MTAFTLGMNQVATYWSPGAPNGYGGRSYGSPVEISCRWESRHTLFRSPEGQELTSEAVVYPDRELAIGGMVALGSYTSVSNPNSLTGEERPRVIRGRNTSPSIGADLVLNKVFL